MAKMQRWRRGRSAGEGANPVEDVQEEHGGVESVDTADPDDPADDLDLDADLDPDLGADPEEDEDLDLDRDPDLDALPDKPALPHVEERQGGPVSWLLGGRRPEDVLAIQLLQAAHAKQAITTALVVAGAAAVSGRSARECLVVLLTVLVGQTILGWHNDIVDRQRDASHGLTNKPLAMGRLDAGTVWYGIAVAGLLLVPLSITSGIRAGCFYLAAVAVGMLGNVILRTGLFSWWSWVVSYALIAAFLSYGGFGGQATGNPPEPAILVLAGLLGIGVHFMRAVWGLVADHEDGWTYLPLRLGLKLGATRLLALSTVYTAAVVIALLVVGSQVGLSQ